MYPYLASTGDIVIEILFLSVNSLLVSPLDGVFEYVILFPSVKMAAIIGEHRATIGNAPNSHLIVALHVRAWKTREGMQNPDCLDLDSSRTGPE